ncbi:MAG: 3-hydroxyacyl-CoA dehydrogenase family protein [Bacteroidota bacterium]
MTIGIVGAGIMGKGLAHQFAKFDHSVVLVDNDPTVLEAVPAGINVTHRFDIMMQRMGKTVEGVQEDVLSKVTCTSQLSDLKGADLIIENIPEVWDLKRALYLELAEVVGPNTLIGVNTSATPIGKLSTLMPHPENVAGMHFSNPVHMMPMVEMVRGRFTSEATLSALQEILKGIKMTGIVVNDAPGFVTNRVMLMYINEAVYCVQEGVATAAEVDKIFRDCLSHAQGPLELADMIGLDTILQSLEVLHENFKDSKYRPCYLLREMVDTGLLGKKSSQGFYTY